MANEKKSKQRKRDVYLRNADETREKKCIAKSITCTHSYKNDPIPYWYTSQHIKTRNLKNSPRAFSKYGYTYPGLLLKHIE